MTNKSKSSKARKKALQKNPKKDVGKTMGNAEGVSQSSPQAPVTPASPMSIAVASSKNDDISDFGIPAEEMIRRCREAGHTVWAYARVSTKAQDLTRQIDRFTGLSIDMEHIIQDKATGTNFEREGFQKLLGLVQEGDVIIFTELDRFGRDFIENVVFAMRITLEKKVGIGFTEHPELNRMGSQPPLHALLSMIIFLTQAYSAHDEHEKILSRTSQGRKVKAKAGAAFGRKPIDITDKFRKMEDGILDGRISNKKARKELGVNYRTLKKWIRYAKKQRMKEAVERKMGILSKKVEAWCGEALAAGGGMAAETVFEIRNLFEKFIEEAGNLASSLSAWRRIPVVDVDGTIIRPATYQRKETELDAEVADLEIGIKGIGAFTDELIKIIGSGGKGVFNAAGTVGQEIAAKDADSTDNACNASGTDDLGSAGEPGRRPSGKAGISSLFPAILEIMEALKEKLEALKQKNVAEF